MLSLLTLKILLLTLLLVRRNSSWCTVRVGTRTTRWTRIRGYR